MEPKLGKVCEFGAARSCKISANLKLLPYELGGRFASEKERLGVQATLTHCRPLEAHLSHTVGQQGAEAKLGRICRVATIW